MSLRGALLIWIKTIHILSIPSLVTLRSLWLHVDKALQQYCRFEKVLGVKTQVHPWAGLISQAHVPIKAGTSPEGC